MTLPQRSWFLVQPPSDLHGQGHTARVMAWACVLTHPTEWFEPVVWAAVCHDLRRRDDGVDPDHGFRASAWVRRTLPSLLRRPPSALELIARACDWHVCSDRHTGWDHPVLWYLKDADGLDRSRLYDLDPAYLRHTEARHGVEQGHHLYSAAAMLDDPAQIWQVALDQGLPVHELVEFVKTQSENLRVERGAATTAVP